MAKEYQENREEKVQYAKKNYQQTKDAIAKRKAKEYQENKEKKAKCYKDRLSSFQSDLENGLLYPCVSCRKLFFKAGLKIFQQQQFQREIQNNNSIFIKCFETSLPDECNINGHFYICHNCSLYIQKNEQPPQNYYNGLQLEHQPKELKQLTEYEATLISPILLFFKIFLLPVSRIQAIKGTVLLITYYMLFLKGPVHSQVYFESILVDLMEIL